VQRIQGLFKEVNLPDSQQQWAWQALAWKLRKIPRDAKSVLSIGCAGGIELILIRGLLPQVELTAVDFESHLVPYPEQLELRWHFVGGTPD
jgi:hypothetical protein